MIVKFEWFYEGSIRWILSTNHEGENILEGKNTYLITETEREREKERKKKWENR